jgi:hypothetical protein
MSDMGLLSQQYQALSALARQLRQYAVLIKRFHYHIPESAKEATTTSINLTTACAELARVTRFLRDVIEVENEGSWPEYWVANPPLPTGTIERLRAAHVYDMPLFVKRLERLAEHLEQGANTLVDKDIELLDSIVLAANADTNAVFRRLMRWV